LDVCPGSTFFFCGTKIFNLSWGHLCSLSM
jgi:hypothetical protein